MVGILDPLCTSKWKWSQFMKHAKLGNQKAFDLSFGFYKNLVGMESLVLFAPICKVNLGLESRSQETRDQVFPVVHWHYDSTIVRFIHQNYFGPCKRVYGKTGSKNVQPVLQHCCKTSWNATMLVLPITFKLKPVLQLLAVFSLFSVNMTRLD